MDISVVLPTYKKTVIVKREVLVLFPQSLLAQAVEGQPETKELILERPEVTPNTLEWLNCLATGERVNEREIQRWLRKGFKPNAGIYLNIPFLTVISNKVDLSLVKRGLGHGQANVNYLQLVDAMVDYLPHSVYLRRAAIIDWILSHRPITVWSDVIRESCFILALAQDNRTLTQMCLDAGVTLDARLSPSIWEEVQTLASSEADYDKARAREVKLTITRRYDTYDNPIFLVMALGHMELLAMLWPYVNVANPQDVADILIFAVHRCPVAVIIWLSERGVYMPLTHWTPSFVRQVMLHNDSHYLNAVISSDLTADNWMLLVEGLEQSPEHFLTVYNRSQDITPFLQTVMDILHASYEGETETLQELVPSLEIKSKHQVILKIALTLCVYQDQLESLQMVISAYTIDYTQGTEEIFNYAGSLGRLEIVKWFVENYWNTPYIPDIRTLRYYATTNLLPMTEYWREAVKTYIRSVLDV
jgi:hypothetical protein